MSDENSNNEKNLEPVNINFETMKKTPIQKTVLLLLILFAFVGCNGDDNCELVIPREPIGSFFIVDENGNDLIGESNIYQFEDMKLYDTGNDEIELYLGDIGSMPFPINFNFGNMESNINYFLELNEAETDTLKFVFEEFNGDCFDVRNISKAFVNGDEVIVLNDNQFTIVK